MPRVTILLPSAVNSSASRTMRLNSSTSRTSASDGVTTILAEGSFCLIFQQAYAMHGAVLRAHGSAMIFSTGISGSCSLTICTYGSLVTTQKLLIGQMTENLSTVIWIIVLPQPITSMNCLGYSGVLIGQNLLPIPPAIITT